MNNEQQKHSFLADTSPRNRVLYNRVKSWIRMGVDALLELVLPWLVALLLSTIAAVVLGAFQALQPEFNGSYVELAWTVIVLAFEWAFYGGAILFVLRILGVMRF